MLHTHLPSPILVELGAVKVYWYGTLYLVSIVLGYLLVQRSLALETRRGRQGATTVQRDLIDLGFGLVMSGLIGARLYHVLNAWPYYWMNPQAIFAVWNGGLAIHGAL